MRKVISRELKKFTEEDINNKMFEHVSKLCSDEESILNDAFEKCWSWVMLCNESCIDNQQYFDTNAGLGLNWNNDLPLGFSLCMPEDEWLKYKKEFSQAIEENQ